MIDDRVLKYLNEQIETKMKVNMTNVKDPTKGIIKYPIGKYLLVTLEPSKSLNNRYEVKLNTLVLTNSKFRTQAEAEAFIKNNEAILNQIEKLYEQLMKGEV